MQAIKSDLNLSTLSTSPIPAQPGSNATQLNAPQSDFKKALQDTDDKPVRKGGKHQPDPGNDPPAAPAPVTAIATPAANLAVVVPVVGALTPEVDDSRSLANVDVAATVVAASGQNLASTSAATPLGANLDAQAESASLIRSGSTDAVPEKGAPSTAAAAPVAAQTAVKAGTAAVMNAKVGGNDASGANTTSANAVGASAATNDPGSSAAAPTADANVTSQTLLASTMAAAATTVAPAAASPSADTFTTPVSGVTPTAAANLAAPVAMDGAQPATAAAAASVAQVVIGAVQSAAAEKHSHAPTADKASSSVSIEGAAGFAQLINSSSSADAAPATLKVTAGVDSPGFAQGVGSQVQVMVDNNLNTAKLQVSPASLGPIEVRIAIQNGHAQVWMTSHSAVTRDALESSTPQLKEMLGSQGFSQVSVDISQRSFQERTPQPHTYDWQPLSGDDSAVPIQSVAASAARGGSGVVDAYA